MTLKIQYNKVCQSCKGTGVYVGMAERGGAAVECTTCKGSGCQQVRVEYEPFVKREKRTDVKRVIKTNPGICVGSGNGLSLEDFGGMDYQDWLENKDYPPKSEMRKFVCPAWWYQCDSPHRRPEWKECMGCGRFSDCEHFPKKGNCWERWDRENKPEGGQ